MQTTKELYHLKRGILLKYSFFFLKSCKGLSYAHFYQFSYVNEWIYGCPESISFSLDSVFNSMISITRVRDSATDFEPCSKLEDLNLDRKNSIDIGERYAAENSSRRY